MFLAGQGLDRADKWASVLGLFLNVVGALAAVTGVWLAWQTRATAAAGFAEALEAQPLRPGDPHRVGSFRLLGRVGAGAMGLVYLGRSPDGTLAAVKVMRSDLADDLTFRRRFEHEMRDIGRIVGPRFPPLLKADVTADRPWLATEYQPGLPLDDVLAATGPWDLRAVAWLACGVAEALTTIHGHGIVHRDLKPSNVLVDVDGPRVIDFGIAQAADDTRLTRTGALLGTVAFMSPEQARGARNIGPQADVFALGSLLAYAGTGRPPFGDSPAHAVLNRILSKKPDLGQLAGSRHPVTELVRACLNKDPAKRPTPAEVLEICRPFANRPVADWLPEAVRSRIDRRRTVVRSGTGRPLPGRAAPAGPGRRPLAAATSVRAAGAAALVVLVAVGSWVVWWPEDWRSALGACGGPADTTLRMASSADKSILLRELAAEYGLRAADGRCVEVVVDEHNSGSTMTALARGWSEADGPRPDVWSPASTEWLHMARQRATRTAAAVLPAREPEPIVTTPLVIAMPEPMATALGWPATRDIGWRKLAELATDELGWARYGKDWGPFRLGKTNPNYSTSGLNATIGAFYASRGGTGELADADIDSQAAREFVHDIEQSIVHYGPTSLHFLTNLRRADDEDRALSYVSAVTVEESSMLAYNAGHPDGTSASERITPPKTKLVAIVPQEGTIDSDHPYIDLTWPDTTPAQRAVARDFLGYLHSAPVQQRFQEYGFRDHRGRPGPLATPENGFDPDAPITPLPVPKAPVLDKVLTAWTSLRKPARVLLAIDTSNSMNEGVTNKDPAQQTCPAEDVDPVLQRCPTKIEWVKRARQAIADGFTDSERVGLWKFSEDLDGDRDYRELLPVAPMGELQRIELVRQIDALTTDTETGLYDTIAAAVRTIAQDPGEDTINAVVVLTDGRDSGRGSYTLERLIAELEPTQGAEPVRVFTIAYGFGSDDDSLGRSVLEQIAEATGAAKYDAKDSHGIIEDLVVAIVSNF